MIINVRSQPTAAENDSVLKVINYYGLHVLIKVVEDKKNAFFTVVVMIVAVAVKSIAIAVVAVVVADVVIITIIFVSVVVTIVLSF